jgi:hypothetical protein
VKRERLVARRNKECIKHLAGGTHKRKTCAHVSETERKRERKPISVTKDNVFDMLLRGTISKMCVIHE